MQIYNPTAQKITLNGVDYFADENGIIDVPDSKINSSVWTQGFVSAKGRLAELAKNANEPAIAPEPESLTKPAAEMPVKKDKTAALLVKSTTNTAIDKD